VAKRKRTAKTRGLEGEASTSPGERIGSDRIGGKEEENREDARTRRRGFNLAGRADRIGSDPIN
jgi:hypothetical protein